MLEIQLNEIKDAWDEVKEEYVSYPAIKLQLEHSLISISKWESKWHKPFLQSTDKTNEEMLDYIRCMIINKNIPNDTVYRLTSGHIKLINEYILNPMTATTINSKNKKSSNKILTSERLYYYMVAAQIPFECEKWHLNRLIKLIEICSIENEPPKKMSKRDVMKQYTDLNTQRKKALGTNG